MALRRSRNRMGCAGSGAAAAAVALAAALVVTGCAGPSTSEAISRHEFTRDQERCWLQTTSGLTFACPDGPCAVTIPDRVMFQRCMERRGWELEDLDVAAPREPLSAPDEDWEHEDDADWNGEED